MGHASTASTVVETSPGRPRGEPGALDPAGCQEYTLSVDSTGPQRRLRPTPCHPGENHADTTRSGRQRTLHWVVVMAALFAVALPTSIDGAISPLLSAVSLLATCALLGAMFVMSPSASPSCTLASLAVFGLPLLFTVTSPFIALSPGVVVIYLWPALLYSTDLRHERIPGVDRLVGGFTLVALVAGYAVALDVGVVDAFLVRWYGAFYPELLSNMVVANNKPVFSFATHSMAGFVYYVLFYRQLLQWRQGGGWWAAATAFGYLSLLFLLTSTTGWAFGGVAAAQLAMELARSAGRYAALAVIAVALVGVAAATALGLAPDRMLDTVQTALVGDRVRCTLCPLRERWPAGVEYRLPVGVALRTHRLQRHRIPGHGRLWRRREPAARLGAVAAGRLRRIVGVPARQPAGRSSREHGCGSAR